ncbi:hypothetical protein [uncultured Winogradskyella sp.]|uniref:hypothetical protein n=1 Tax=uncultured Winogradskyella sp. TaxID=395353 RepID=UPI00262E1D9A|nr:hypothetical protein [uncultured Winogradskyella sp.]
MGEEKRKKKWIKTLQFLAAYLVAAWTFLQFIDWILNRYDISPNWVDLLLWIFVGVIPSLLIYFYHQDRINEGILKLREKIIFPLNIILLAVITYFGFGSSDLGATTKEISYTNDTGNLETQLITKEEFRIGLPIYEFEPKIKDTANTWLKEGIQELLYQDLLQDKTLSVFTSDSNGTVNKVTESRIFNDYYVDGTYEVVGETYKVTPTIRNAKNGKILSEKTFEGNNLLNLLDDASVFIKDNIGLTEVKRDLYIDLNLSEFYSSSLEAIKAHINRDYYRAQELDPAFAISYFENAQRSIRFSYGEEGEKKLINQAYKYSGKLPLQRQLQIRILRHIAYEEWDMAEKLLKLQLEIDPSDEIYNRLLYAVYGETKQVDAYAEYCQERFDKNRSITNGSNLINASIVAGNYDKVINAITNLELVQPNNQGLSSFKIRPQLLKGDIKAAKKTQERTKLLNPDWKNFTTPVDSVIDYLSNNEATKKRLEKFVGKYRSQISEQEYEYWIDDDKILSYVSNQELSAPILADDNKLMLGSYVYRSVIINEFLEDDTGIFYASKNTEYNYNTKNDFYYWKYDSTIKNAEEALSNNDLGNAEKLYKTAIEKFPKHYFLKLALQHIEYTKSITDEELQKQYSKITGNYSARHFWVEDKKLYYEREGLPKLHLYPISEDRYISLSRYGTQYAFEVTESGKLASAVYSYENETGRWNKLMANNNYLLKDE